MALDRLTEDLNYLASLGDDPKRDDGLSTSQFKSHFDKAGLVIQNFINNKLIPQIESFLDEGKVLGKITEALNKKFDKSGGTMEGPINMNGQKLKGLNAPVADNEAATKGYVDAVKTDVNNAVRQAAPYQYAHNSDFTKFIAQAGIGGKHGNQAYAGDRWILDSGTVTGDAREDGNGYNNITLNGTIRQIVDNAPDVGTAAIEMVAGTAQISYANGEIIVTSNGGVINNVRLFKGSYTADNLPAYQPNAYAAELLKCKRYFLRFKSYDTVGNGIIGYAGGVDILIPLAVPMRVAPSFSGKVLAQAIGAGEWLDFTTTPQQINNYGHALEIRFPDGSVDSTYKSQACQVRLTYGGLFEISADFPED